jgi:hypothetical protein
MKLGIEVGHDARWVTSRDEVVRASWYVTVSYPCLWGPWQWKGRTWRFYYGNV